MADAPRARFEEMKLYYSPGACSLASHIVMRELKAPAEYVKVDLKSHKTEKGEDYKAINPKGYVPAITLDDGDLLTENVAVLPYLASLGKDLFPESGMSKWHATEMLAFVSTEIHKSFKPLFDPTSTDEAKKKAKDQIAGRLEIAASKLGSRSFIVGDRFTVVDAYLFVMLLWSQKQGVKIPPSLQTYFDQLKARPAVKEALSQEGLS